MTRAIVRATGGAIEKRADVAGKLKRKYAEARAVAARFDRIALFDASGSMSAFDAIGFDGQPASRWDVLRAAWSELAPQCKGRLAAYTFSNAVTPVKGSASGEIVNLPYQGADTRMCAAVREVGKYGNPRMRVLLVSDGEPTDGNPVPDAAALGVPFDCVFVGPRGSAGAALLVEIAFVTGGTFQDFSGVFDASRFLEHCTRAWLLGAG